jgi:hypothetical protein
VALSGSVANIREVSQRPEDSETVGSSHGDSERTETEGLLTARQRTAMESFHGEAVSGWRGNILTAIQLASSGWRRSHVTARQRKDSEGFWCSQATELVVERRSIGRVFNDRVKVELGSAM